MSMILLAARLTIAGVFTVAGAAKLLSPSLTRQTLSEFGVPLKLLSVWLCLPILEIATAASLVPATYARYGASMAASLLSIFSVVLVVHLLRGETPRCYCFGEGSAKPISWKSVLRNAILLAGSVALALSPEHLPLSDAAHSMLHVTKSPNFYPAVVVVFGIALIGEFIFLVQLFIQHGRILLQMDALTGASFEPSSASPQSPAPNGLARDFLLPDRNGIQHSMRGLLGDSGRLLLFFLDPQCGACHGLARDLSAVCIRIGDRARVAVITRSAEGNSLPDLIGDDSLLIMFQHAFEVTKAYQIAGNPAVAAVVAPGVVEAVAVGVGPIMTFIDRLCDAGGTARTNLGRDAPSMTPSSVAG